MSRIIKLTHYAASDDSVLLSVRPAPKQTETDPEKLQKKQEILQEADSQARAIVQDAEETAQNILRQAAEQADELKRKAMEEIEAWWEQKRAEAEALFQETRERAVAEGYAAGHAQGKSEAYEEETGAINKAREILELAYSQKEKIIAEAEPFLVELSIAVAEKVICGELGQKPEQVLEMAKKVLNRSRVYGTVTICVNPRYYELVQENRAQLLALLDGQAELAVCPDHSVQDGGCVIRTQMGSVDARVTTQLEEIKRALLEIARGSEQSDDH